MNSHVVRRDILESPVRILHFLRNMTIRLIATITRIPTVRNTVHMGAPTIITEAETASDVGVSVSVVHTSRVSHVGLAH